MNLTYHPNAPRGEQYTLNGIKLSRLDVFSTLRNTGLSISQANQRIAAAKLAAAV